MNAELIDETMNNLFALVAAAETKEEAIELKSKLLRPIGVLCSKFGLGKSNLHEQARQARRRRSRSAKSNAYEG